MSSEIMQETTPLVECSAFHRGMSVLEASLRNTEDSDSIISGLLKGAAEFYGASRASVVEADWDLGIGVITYEWCKDGVPAQRDMLQCLPMEKFPRWRKALRANKPVVISDLQRLEKVYPDEAAFFREYGVTTLLAAPFSKRINQGFIAVDDPTRYTDDPVFLFIASYAVVVELNEIKQQQSLLAATKASKYNPEDIHINFFGGMEIISSKGTLTGEDIKADQCYLLLAYLILNHKKNFSVDTLAEIICPYDELDSPYKVVNNIVYRLRRTLSVIGLDKLVIGKNGTFQINPNSNIHTDFDRFEDACIQLKTEENPDMRHSLYHSAVDMYKGQLLPRYEHELWLMQLSIVIQESEAKLVQEIFLRYIAGESLNELTESLRQQDIPYDEGRLWNKNMVARILADIRYTGEKEYPKLIDKEQLIAANEKRSNKPQLPKKTEAQKVLRRLCGAPPSERVEQSVTDLLNGLANCPERIQHRRSPTPVTYSKTQEALDNALEQQPIDEDTSKTLILQLAAEQYAALGDEEYETVRLRRLFSAFECVAELNADLLKNTVSEVLVTHQNVKLRLKNGQIIERSDLQ